MEGLTNSRHAPVEGIGEALRRLRRRAGVGDAERRIREDDDRTVGEQIELSEIPAPPFGERPRGERMAELMAAAGLEDVRLDEVGNVLGVRRSANGLPAPDGGRVDSPETRIHAGPLVVSAHLDTVFPEGTDVRVHRDGDRLRGAGIADDARGLAALLAVARALRHAGIRTRTPLLFAATVGEEGAGDLRGVKHLFGTQGAARAATGFISLEGAGLDHVVSRGLGSRRLRIEVAGPGGHSWADWGQPNPIHLLATLAAQLIELPTERSARTTLTIARWGGGKSVNSIPQSAWIEVDMRSASDESVRTLEAEVRRIVADHDRHPGVRFGVESIGLRPAGETPADALLVRAAVEATRDLGRAPRLALSSTDANVPMSMGVPAIALGAGGSAGKAHTTEEWYRNVGGPEGVVRALHTVLLAAGYDASPATEE
jgi:tripeptide aminopeptidase